jgi:putative ABC transport system ATP-binding protein/macrolide transport system ATP-binding/permease protein/lipoprotein-releasing system ATP-binding protein
MLQARNLSKTYATGARPVEAVSDLSLDVSAGEFVVVCGRSGSGKSTLLGMLGGICRPTGGTVRLDGADVWSLPADGLADFRNRQVGFVFQFASLLPALRAIDNVALPALVAGREGPEAVYLRAEKLLARVGLGDRLEAYPGELSGGQQRRVALARALVNEPPLILADEPTGDLDEETEVEVFRLLLGLHRERGTTLLVVTHNPELAREADRVLHLRGGRAVSITVPECRPREVVEEQVVPPAPDGRPGPDGEAAGPEARRALGGLGAGFGRVLKGVAAWAAVVVVAALVLNYGTALYQQSRVAGRKAARQQLQEVALYRMRADVEDLAYGPDRSYLLTLYTQNLEPEQDLFVMAPEVRAFVQVGLQWQEVPLRPEDNQEGRVVRVTADKRRFRFRFTPDVKAFEEILPGYMHVRFSNVMLVSRNAEPKGDLIERRDDYYVYLKPHGADDATILGKTKFPGTPPLWIPMPPH